jgi:hypothetical protein
LKADLVSVKYEVDPQNEAAEMLTRMNAMMYGPEGLVTRTFYLKDRMLQSLGGGKADAQAMLDAVNGKNAVGGQAAYQATRKQLLPKANLIGLVDLPRAIALGLELAVQAGAPVPLGDNDIKTIRGEPSYLGFSLATDGNGLRAKTVIPVAQMQGVARTVNLLRPANNNPVPADEPELN